MTTMDVITNRKKKSKPSETEKNETKEKRKRKRNSEIRADGDSELQQTSENDGPSVVNDSSDKLHASNNNNTTRSEKETKKKKKKKDKKTKKSKKKKENKKSKEKETESDTESKSEREHESESNHHDERTNGGSAAIEDSGSGNGNGNGNGRLVASSAIEFYDDDLKKKAKKRQKLATKASETETEAKTKTKAIASIASTSKADENAAGLEEALRKQRSKAKKKKRNRSDSNDNMNNNKNNSNNHTNEEHLDKLRQRDELDKVLIPEKKRDHSLTLLLFYQYIEPEWDDETHERMLRDLQRIGTSLELTGRMRCAREGLNCTLTGRHSDVLEYTRALRQLRPNDFCDTEFKLTTDLPLAQKFGELKVLPVVEIVRYGLEGQKAPPIRQYSGVHLEPRDYHKKLAESNTVVIDVRNHYEAAIGRFVPPTTGEAQKQKQAQAQEHEQQANADHGPKWIDPKMRKSTEFPAWLDKDETKEMMKGKQVLMYCTGGIRCERASALLKYKMETDPSVKDLGIKGVFQLQGGIDKYFKEFPDGGYWKGKNYVFDKRFAHAPPKIDGELHGRATAAAAASDKNDKNAATTNNSNHTKTTNVASATASAHVMGKCEACHKPWDMYRGKRRCPTCGVPSLICKDCFLADKEGRKKLTREVRCDLCVEQGIFSKRQYRETDERFIREYESKMTAKGLLLPNAVAAAAAAATTHANRVAASATADAVPNPKGITRLVLKNMCRKRMNEDALLKALPAVTHVSWNTQRNHRTKKKNSGAEGAGEPIFTGMGWVEMATPEDAARAVALNNKLTIFGRTIGIAFQAPDGKDVWPPPNSRVA